MKKYTTRGTLVKGRGYSWKLNNQHDATTLCRLLNEYEEKIQNEQDRI